MSSSPIRDTFLDHLHLNDSLGIAQRLVHGLFVYADGSWPGDVLSFDPNREALEVAGVGDHPVFARKGSEAGKTPWRAKEWQKTRLSLTELERHLADYRGQLFDRDPTAASMGNSNPNLCWILGLSNLCCIDIDPRNGGSLEKLRELLGDLPETVQDVTGNRAGGGHFFFRAPAEGILPTKAVIQLAGGGIEFFHGTHFVVVPPSVHRHGRPYRWINDPRRVPFATLPQVVIDRVCEAEEATRRAKRDQREEAGERVQAARTTFLVERALARMAGCDPDEVKFVHPDDSRVAGEGERNDALHRHLSRWRAKGENDLEIEARAFRFNREKCSPPLNDAEVLATVGSVCRYRVGSSAYSPLTTTSPALAAAILTTLALPEPDHYLPGPTPDYTHSPSRTHGPTKAELYSAGFHSADWPAEIEAAGAAYHSRRTDSLRNPCENPTIIGLEHLATGNPLEVTKRCGHCEGCQRHKLEVNLGVIRAFLGSAQAAGAVLHEACIGPEDWDRYRRRYHDAADHPGKGYFVFRAEGQDGEADRLYLVSTVPTMGSPVSPGSDPAEVLGLVLAEATPILEAAIRRGGRPYSSSRSWEKDELPRKPTEFRVRATNLDRIDQDYRQRILDDVGATDHRRAAPEGHEDTLEWRLTTKAEGWDDRSSDRYWHWRLYGNPDAVLEVTYTRPESQPAYHPDPVSAPQGGWSDDEGQYADVWTPGW